MKRAILFAALIVTAVAGSQAAEARHAVHRRHAATPDNSITYNKDSKDPNVGWHTDSSGMRVCHQDCDNPEIPGSGATCHDVTVMGMAMRECVTTN